MKKLVYDKETKEIVIEEIESSEEKEPKIIKIKKSEFYTEFITRGNKNFFNKLLIKLNIWSK